MRLLFTLCICFVSLIGYTQVDSITVPVDMIIHSAETIKDQQDTIKHQRVLITEWVHQNELQSIILQQDSVEISLLNTRVGISDKIIDRYESRLKKEGWFKRSWKAFAFGAGVVVGVLISK